MGNRMTSIARKWCEFILVDLCMYVCTDAPSVAISVALSRYLSLCNPLLQYDKQHHVSAKAILCYCTLIFGLCLLYNCCCHCCVSCQYLQPVRVAQPWHSRMVLPRRTLLLGHCPLTSLWDQCQRRTQRMKSQGSLTCSWRKRRLGPCPRPPVAQTAPMKWDLTTLMAPYRI